VESRRELFRFLEIIAGGIKVNTVGAIFVTS
jgi:hypothetical protein